MKSHETAYVWNVRLASLHIAVLMKEILDNEISRNRLRMASKGRS